MADEMVMDAPAEVEVNDPPVEEVEQPEGEVSDIGDATDEPEETEGEEESEGDEGEEKEGSTEPVSPDGRTMRDSVKKGLKQLSKIDPAAAKELKGVYWEREEYKAVFEKPSDAVAAKTFLEEIGGQEGVQEIAAERQEWQQVDKGFQEASPDFYKNLANDNPEAFVKGMPHAINEFAQRAGEQYQWYANRLTLNTLSNAGLSMQNLRGVYDRMKDSNPEAAAVVAEVYNSLFEMNDKAAQFEQKRPDPREEQLSKREQEFETKRRGDFESGIETSAKQYLAEKMKPEIDRIVNGRKVDTDAMKGFEKMVQDEVGKLLAAVPGIEDKLEAYYRTGDAQKSIAYVQSQYNRLLPQAAKVIEPYVRNFGPAAAAKAAPVKTANGKPAVSSPGSVVLKEMPAWDQIDFDKCTTADVMQGNAVLKSGKKASGWA